ncbi:MAG: molybdopterin-dependent oxidoreductase [Planctomycetota bacterium]|jgi:sulfoxide reductase catalytic subunit YedY
MERRRQFLKSMFGYLTGAGILFSPFVRAVRAANSNAKKIILPKDINREKLIYRNPARLDTRNLEPTPLKNFGIMGDSNYSVDLNDWRLEVTGGVGTPLSLTYSQILSLTSIERNVLLICRGFFANHGRWKGISMGTLLEKAQMQTGVTHVTFSAPKGAGGNKAKFPFSDILSDRVFLAYGVNAETLPKKHGFPLRLVAEDYNGSVWVKYVSRVRLDKT